MFSGRGNGDMVPVWGERGGDKKGKGREVGRQKLSKADRFKRGGIF